MQQNQKQIEELHKAYIEGTGLNVVLSMDRVYAWDAWLAKGWTLADLRQLLRYCKWRNRERGARPINLSFRALIGTPENFEELLASARHQQRAREQAPPPAKQMILQGTKREPKGPDRPAKTAEQIMRESELFKRLRQQEGL